MQTYPFRPSGSPRWTRCLGSEVLIAAGKFPDTDNPAALLGRITHALAAMAFDHSCTVKAIAATHIIDTDTLQAIALDRDIRRCAETYVSTVRTMAAGAFINCETTLPVFDAGTGTTDAWYRLGRLLSVHDLKSGRVEIRAAGNTQLIMYAWAVLQYLQRIMGTHAANFIDKVQLVIHQPHNHTVDEVTMDLSAFLNEVDKVAAKRDRIKTIPLADVSKFLTPGLKQCRYCPARAECEALSEKITEALRKPDIAVVAGAVDNEALAECCEAAPLAKVWADAVLDLQYSKMRAGEVVPGFKLVDGKMGRRFWEKAEKAESLLLSTYGPEFTYAKTLLGVKPFGDEVSREEYKILAPYIGQKRGAYRVVKNSAKGDPVDLTAERTKDIAKLLPEPEDNNVN